jgi:hypothetical protein
LTTCTTQAPTTQTAAEPSSAEPTTQTASKATTTESASKAATAESATQATAEATAESATQATPAHAAQTATQAADTATQATTAESATYTTTAQAATQTASVDVPANTAVDLAAAAVDLAAVLATQVTADGVGVERDRIDGEGIAWAIDPWRLVRQKAVPASNRLGLNQPRERQEGAGTEPECQIHQRPMKDAKHQVLGERSFVASTNCADRRGPLDNSWKRSSWVPRILFHSTGRKRSRPVEIFTNFC